MLRFLSLTLSLSVACHCRSFHAAVEDQPSYPRWPDQFTQNLTDYNIWLTGTHSTRGTIIYDWTNQRYRLDRENGRYDRYCGTNGVTYQFINTPCSHVVVDGNRYLYYPEKNDCCFCCDAAAGCGILKPDWLSGATFYGNVSYTWTDGSTASVYKWEKDGIQSNYYYESIEADPVSRVMAEIDEEPNERQVYDSTRLDSVDSSQLELPSICSPSKSCSSVSVCAALSHATHKKVKF